MPIARRSSLLLCLAVAACATAPRHSDVAANWAAQGKTQLAAGQVEAARDSYLKATAADDRDAHAWNGLGVADAMQNRPDEAEDAYRHALDIAPRDLGALNNLARLYLARGDRDDALDLLRPFAGDPELGPSLRDTYDAARGPQALPYADLGSYATDAMARAHLDRARGFLGADSDGLSFEAMPEVKVPGGTPLFTAVIRGPAPQQICDRLMAQAYPCTVTTPPTE